MTFTICPDTGLATCDQCDTLIDPSRPKHTCAVYYYIPYTRTIEAVLKISAGSLDEALKEAGRVLDEQREHDERLVFEEDTDWEIAESDVEQAT